MADVLLAEDCEAYRAPLALLLQAEGHVVREAADGEEALAQWRRRRPDLLVLDVMMPRRSGFDVCREIRAHDPFTPILFLSAKADDADKIRGLGLGADNYLSKTASALEIAAHATALLRRAAQSRTPAGDAGARFAFAQWQIDARAFEARQDGRAAVRLTPREVELTRLFADRAGEAVSRAEILGRLWGVDYYGNTRTLDQHVATLRRKLELAPGRLETVSRVGYRYNSAPTA